MLKTSLSILIMLSFLLSLAAQRGITDSYAAEANGDHGTALAIMTELFAQDSTDAFYQVRIAWLQYLRANYAEALLAYQNAISLQDNLDARIGLINSLLALGRYPEALEQCRQQTALHPENYTLLAKGGYAAYMVKDYRGAAEFYALIAKVAPWDMENRGYLMNNLYLSEQEEAAREQYLFLRKYYPQSALLPPYKQIFEP